MSVLREIRQILIDRSSSLPDEAFIPKGIYKIEMAFSPSNFDLAFMDTVILVQTLCAGFCTCYKENPIIDPNWIGCDLRELEIPSPAINIALLDAAFGSLAATPTYTLELKGGSHIKALARASVISSEISRLASSFSRRPRILMIGAVGSLIEAVSSLGMDVVATELDSHMIGKEQAGVSILDGSLHTTNLLADVDLALVTGMTLATETLDQIMEIGQRNFTKIVMFAQTGANFAPFYVERGCDVVISEQFPNYIFPGDTSIRVAPH